MKLDCIHQYRFQPYDEPFKPRGRLYRCCSLKSGFMLKQWRCKYGSEPGCDKGRQAFKKKRGHG